MIGYKLAGKTIVFFLVLFELTAFLGSVRASELQTFETLQKKIESLEKEILNLKMKNIVENKFEWQILKLSEIENDIKRLHNRFEILENNYYQDLKAIKGRTNDIKKRVLSLEGKTPNNEEELKTTHSHGDTQINSDMPVEISEEEEVFNSALNLHDSGNLTDSENKFSDFIEKYPNSSLLPNAFYWRAETKANQENWIGAANDYLESFSISPSGEYSPKTLFGLGISLGAIGEKEQACLTLDEVGMRFPDVGAVLSQDIEKAKKILNCG